MKVIFTLDSLAYGGTEKSTLDLIRHFSSDTDARVVFFHPGFDLLDSYKEAGIPVEYVDLKGKRSFIKGAKALLEIIKREKPDLIVSSIMRANFYSRLAGKWSGTKVVGTFVNDRYSPIGLQTFKGFKQKWGFRFFWKLDQWTAKIPQYYISNSIAIAHSNAKALKLPKHKVKVIYRGRDHQLFAQWQPHTNRDTFRFAFLARLVDSKGLPELIKALGKIAPQYPHVFLDVYGDGTYRNKLLSLIRENGVEDRVVLHGKVPNGWKKLYDADCFVFPSRFEGFSGSLVEAMMTGVPIIASDIPMNLEAVTNETALIFPTMQADELANRMEKMLKEYDSMIAMGQRARQLAIKRFDIRNVAAQYESFLKDVVHDKVDKIDLI